MEQSTEHNQSAVLNDLKNWNLVDLGFQRLAK
jgi:hypothetical protein